MHTAAAWHCTRPRAPTRTAACAPGSAARPTQRPPQSQGTVLTRPLKSCGARRLLRKHNSGTGRGLQPRPGEPGPALTRFLWAHLPTAIGATPTARPPSEPHAVEGMAHGLRPVHRPAVEWLHRRQQIQVHTQLHTRDSNYSQIHKRLKNQQAQNQ